MLKILIHVLLSSLNFRTSETGVAVGGIVEKVLFKASLKMPQRLCTFQERKGMSWQELGNLVDKDVWTMSCP